MSNNKENTLDVCDNCHKGIIDCPGCTGEGIDSSIKNRNICAGCEGTGVRVCGKCNGSYLNKNKKIKKSTLDNVKLKKVLTYDFKFLFTLFAFALFYYITIIFFNDAKAVDPHVHYINVDFIIDDKIVRKNHRGEIEKLFSIHMIQDTNVYGEYKSNIKEREMDEYIWNKYQKGDTLHFDYIVKNRFYRRLE